MSEAKTTAGDAVVQLGFKDGDYIQEFGYDEDVDLDLIAPALPGVVLHRVFLLGDSATPELVARVIDQIIVPACTRP